MITSVFTETVQNVPEFKQHSRNARKVKTRKQVTYWCFLLGFQHLC